MASKPDTHCILVVEDDPMVRLFIAGQLREYGYSVFEAETGEQAISLLNAEHLPSINILFTDIQLGGQLNGWDVAEAYRETNPQGRVIYASGQYHDGQRRVSESTFFTKPYIPGDLFEAIEGAAT